MLFGFFTSSKIDATEIRYIFIIMILIKEFHVDEVSNSEL